MQRIFYATIFVCAFLLNQFSGFCQPFTLVRDINLGPEYDPAWPTDLVESAGFLFFRVKSGPTAGVWKTDGTDAGTAMVKGLSTGETIEALVEANDLLYFIVSNAASSTISLWKSDGTAAGSALIQTWSDLRILYSAAADGVFYFTLNNPWISLTELWISDGTAAGTRMLKSVSSSSIGNLTAVNGTLFFTAGDAVSYAHRLWKSDGTVAGTVLVKDIFAEASNVSVTNLFNANGTLFFTGDGVKGEELWKSDGTETGTVMVKDIEAGTGGSVVRSFAMANGVIYFFVTGTPNADGLWKTDGTAGGTELVTSLAGNPGNLTNVNGILFFSGYDDINGTELWKSDGSAAGTTIVKDIVAGSTGSGPGALYNANGILYFTARAGNGIGICKSDGTIEGTVLLKDNYQSVLDPRVLIQFTMANGVVYYSAYEPKYGYQLWKTDGTTAGTVMVKNTVPSPNGSPQNFVVANGLVYFSVFSYVNSPGPVGGKDVFHTDGTYSGTARAERINGRYHSYPLDMANHNGELFISGNSSHSNNFSGYELWKISAKGANAIRVKNINTSPNGSGSQPDNFQSVGQFLYFSANDDTTGFELWKSDGTEAGTVLVKDINPAGASNPANLVNVNGVLYFTADNGSAGIELWKSDGTDAGTVMVKNISAGNGSSNPAYLTAVNGLLYFAADDGVNGIELWKSNGTESGTVLVKNIKAGANSSSPSFLTNVNGVLYLAADDGINGIEVWKSNGTDAGTVLVKDIYSGPGGSNPTLFTNLNGIVLFAADDGIRGRELWGSIGTSSGTILVKDIHPGPTGSNPIVLTRIGSNVLFAANDGIHGNEVWLSNGAENDTRLMSEIEPGTGSSNPTEFCEYGSKLMVAATNAMVGSELWIAQSPANISTLVAAITADGPVAVCSGKTVNLKANRGVGYTYQWKRAGVNIAGATQSTYTTTIGGYYTVTITDAFGISSTSQTVNVAVVNPPLATVAAAGPLSFCVGKNVLLKAITGAGYTYQWKKAGVNISNAIQSNYTATVTGSYSVVVTNATGCSATSSVMNVTVNNVPLATVVAGGPLTFCAGKSVLLKAAAGAGYAYQWKWGGAAIAGATSATYTASATGYYTVIVTNATGCSVASTALAVVVKPLPLSTITPAGPTSICSGKNVLLKANTGTNYTYQWIRGATAIPGAVQSNFSATEQGWYTVIVTNSSGCKVTSAAIAVSVNPLPVATITPGGPLRFCAGKNVVLKANTGTNYTYQWKKAGINIAGATQVNYTVTASGVYNVVVTNAAGCPVTSAAVTVTVNIVPLANIVAATSPNFCVGKSVLLKASLGTGYTYQWKKNGVNIAAQTQSTYTANATGIYTVAVSNGEGCTTLSNGINVSVTPAPTAIITANGPLTFLQGGNVVLNASAGAGNTYQWKKDGVNITGATTENYTATAGGSYSVVVTNANGCQAVSQPTVVTVTQTRPITKGFVEQEEMIRLYPNPLYRNDYVNVDWNIIGADKGVVVNVYDVTGKRINSQLLRPGDGTVKVKGASGVYLVELRWGMNNRKVFRVVKID